MSTAALVSLPDSPSLVTTPTPTPTPTPRAAPEPLGPGTQPEARRISIADRVARAFPPLACVRGFRYFARRRIELSNVTDHGVEADVKGQRTQHVQLRVLDVRLAAACSCAAKVLGPAACRHVWATLLEIDRQALLPRLRSTERPLALGPLDAPVPKANANGAKATARAPAKTTANANAKTNAKREPPTKATSSAPPAAKPAKRPRGKAAT